jgi:hypothetical protein
MATDTKGIRIGMYMTRECYDRMSEFAKSHGVTHGRLFEILMLGLDDDELGEITTRGRQKLKAEKDREREMMKKIRRLSPEVLELALRATLKVEREADA